MAMHVRDFAEGFETLPAKVTHRDERAAWRLEDMEIIAAGLGSRAMFRRDQDLRQIDDRRRHEELMRFLYHVELLPPCAEIKSFFYRFARYVDRQVFRLARPHHYDEGSHEQKRDAEQRRASCPYRDRGVPGARINS